MLRPEISIMDLTLPASVSLMTLYIIAYNHLSFISISYIWISIIGSFFAIASSYIFNDCIDIDVDTINLPNRPLPSGTITKKVTILYGIILISFSYIIAIFFSIQTFIILSFSFITIILYSYYFKRVSPLSFLFVGFSYGLVPIGVWLSVNPLNVYFIESTIDIFSINYFCLSIGLMICITDFGFSLSGVCRDILGDSNKKIPTFPVTYGIRCCSKFITIFWIIGIFLSLIIWSQFKFGDIYLLISILIGCLLIVKCLFFILNPTDENGGNLFIFGAIYRGILFTSIIVDILINIIH